MHRRQVIRCVPEQVRPATQDERTVASTPQADLLGIKQLFDSGAVRNNMFLDLVSQSYPVEEPGAPDTSDQPSLSEAPMPVPEQVPCPVEAPAQDAVAAPPPLVAQSKRSDADLIIRSESAEMPLVEAPQQPAETSHG